MADSLLDNYNPLYDIHLRQYFALPHMQKHLQKMGLLESTLNLNGDEVYARHHAMMDMMLKNREAQLMKMAELRKKLDAAEKVECCRRIRTGQSPESYRQGKPSRSLSRNRAGQKNGSGGRQRRYSNSFEDRDFVQRIEERNADPVEYNTRDPYKRLSANAKRFNYLHKLDDKTLIAYKDNLHKQLQRLERFREISFGPHSVARQPPPPQASWFFRRRSVLNMRGRKATTGNKLNASHDSRTSCPPTTRKRKDSNSRLPPINPQKNRVPTKPPAPVSLQQITTKLPPAAKKPAPTRGRSSNKRQTTTTTTTTITSVSRPPQISDTNTTTLPTLPSVTGHGIFTGAAAAATAAAIGTAAINMDSLIDNEQPEEHKEEEPSSPRSPVLETQKTFDRSSPTDGVHDEIPTDILDKLADESEKVSEQEEQEFIPRQIVLDNTPIDHTHGDYDDSDSEPEYAEEDRNSEEETFVRQEVGQTAASPTEPAVHVHTEQTHVSPPVSDMTQDSPKELSYHQEQEPSPVLPSPGAESAPSPISSVRSEHEPLARVPPTLIFTEQSTEEIPQSPISSEPAENLAEAQQSPIPDVESTHVVEHFESHDALPQSPVLSVHGGSAVEHEDDVEVPQSPVLSVHSSPVSEHYALDSPVSEQIEHHDPAPQSPVASEKESHRSETHSPVLTVHSSYVSEHHEHDEPARQSPVASDKESHRSETHSPVLSVHSSHVSEHHDHDEPAPQSPVASEKETSLELSPSVYSSQTSDRFENQEPTQQSPIASERDNRSPTMESSVTLQDSYVSEHNAPAPQSPVASEKDVGFGRASSVQSSEHNEHVEPAAHSPVASEHELSSSHVSEHVEHLEHIQNQEAALHSPLASEKDVELERAPSVHSHASENMEHPQLSHQSPVPSEHNVHHEPAPQSPVASEKESEFERAASVHSSHASEHLPHDEPAPHSPGVSEHDEHVDHNEQLPQSPVASERAPSVHSSHASEHQEHHEVEHSPSVHSSHVSEHFEPQEEALRSPALSVHSSHPSEHFEHHEPAPQSPVQSVHSSHAPEHVEQQEEARRSPALSVHSSHPSEHFEHHEPAPESPVQSVHSSHVSEHVDEEDVIQRVEHQEVFAAHPSEHIDLTDVPKSPVLSMNQSYASDQLDHEAVPHSPTAASDPAPKSPVLSEKDAFAPRSPSVHTSDAEEESFEVQHHAPLTQVPAPQSPTAMDLYNPSRDNQESPVMSELEKQSPVPAASAIPIADRIDLEAYHNSPTKESTSPVAVNPIEVQISAEQVAEQLTTPDQKHDFEDIINKSADEEASHLIQEALTEAPAIIDMVNTYEEKEKFPEPESYELNYDNAPAPATNAMMTSIYQANSDHEDNEVHEHHEPHVETKEWDEGNAHVKETTTHSEYSDGNTHLDFQETVTLVTDNGNADHQKESPKSEHHNADNISTDSLIIHDDQQPTDYQMTQSIYQPHQETEEKEWDDGNKHVHEVISEHTDESGKHFTETVTTTTTVIKSGDDLKNNNDEEEDGSDDDKEKIIEEDEEHGSNGNLVRETITTTTRTVTSGGLPEGGILVDDGDETNVSSL